MLKGMWQQQSHFQSGLSLRHERELLPSECKKTGKIDKHAQSEGKDFF